jgi:thiosulfate/3-mercaptopyruvate sulfurtransferase
LSLDGVTGVRRRARLGVMSTPSRPAPSDSAPVALPMPLVSADWLAARLVLAARGQIRIIDSRWYLDGRSGHDAFLAGHLPHAQWIDLDADLSSPGSASQGRHPLPTAEQFAAAMARLGVGDDIPVVVYDDAKGSIAGRLWWLLRSLDHPVAVLDGGLVAWAEAGHVLAVGAEPAPVHPTFTTQPWPASRFVDANEVDTLRRDERALVIDARATERYEQGDLNIDPRRGHVPGARSAPWVGNVDDTGALLDADRLRRRFGALGADTADTITAYCGSGVTACHDLLALELAGFGDRTALYTGSWSQWGADLTRPALTGPDRT